MSACSERCAYCGRCDTRTRRGRPELTSADYVTIRAGFALAGLDPQYLDYHDIQYLFRQGKDVAGIIAAGIEHADLARRFESKKA